MTIEMILEKISVNYKMIDAEDNYKIFKIEGKMNLLCLESENDQFLLSRDLFEYMDDNRLPYRILLTNSSKNCKYYLELPQTNNWVKSCFETCDKEEIYLGKQVLNAKITDEQLAKKMLLTK